MKHKKMKLVDLKVKSFVTVPVGDAQKIKAGKDLVLPTEGLDTCWNGCDTTGCTIYGGSCQECITDTCGCDTIIDTCTCPPPPTYSCLPPCNLPNTDIC